MAFLYLMDRSDDFLYLMDTSDGFYISWTDLMILFLMDRSFTSYTDLMTFYISWTDLMTFYISWTDLMAFISRGQI